MTEQTSSTATVLSNNPIPGILSVLAGVSVFSIQDPIIKELSGAYPVHQIVFVRSMVALPLLFLVAMGENGGILRTRRAGLHLLRGLAMFVAYTAYYLALAALPIAATVALYYTVPLFVAVLSVAFLGERVGLRRGAAIGVGFIGVLIIVRPGSGLTDPAALLVVGADLSYAISALLARRLGATDGAGAMALSASVFYCAASGILGLLLASVPPGVDMHESLRFLLIPWTWPGVRDFALMAACGFVSALGFFFLAQGYRLGEANIIAPFEYVALPWAVLWGYLFFGNLPDSVTVSGATIIVGSGLYILYRERQAVRRDRRRVIGPRSGTLPSSRCWLPSSEAIQEDAAMAGNRNEGEGSRTAAREYNKATREFAETHDVDAKAKEARDALEGKEGDRLRQAERAGKAHAKEEDPAVKRSH